MSASVAALSVGTLGVPAMLAAGLASSAHCALMCGALYANPGRGIDASRLIGRLLAYVAIGAVAGGAGAWLLQAATWSAAGQGLRLLLLPLIVWMLVRSIRSMRARRCCDAKAGARPSGPIRRLAMGFVAALLPCPLLFAAAGYAMLAGGAWQGAALLLAFGVGTTPAVQAGAWTWARAAALPMPAPALVMGASAVALLAAAGAPALVQWCVGR